MKLSKNPSNHQNELKPISKSPIRNLMSAIALAAALAITPNKANAEGPLVELEEAVSIGLPFAKRCPSPFRYGNGRLRLAEEVSYDVHGHPIAKSSSGRCQDSHPKYSLGLSYTFAPEPEQAAAEEEEEHGHPVHRIKTQISLTAIKNILELAPKAEFSIPTKEEKFQYGAGTSVILRPARYHEVTATGLARFTNNGLKSWETGLSYSGRIFDQLALGGGCMAEGHSEESHWGCGPNIQVNYGILNIAFDGAWGPDQFRHFHISTGIGLGGAAGHRH